MSNKNVKAHALGHLVVARLGLWGQTAEEWGNPVYIQSVRKKVPLRDLSLNLASCLGLSCGHDTLRQLLSDMSSIANDNHSKKIAYTT